MITLGARVRVEADNDDLPADHSGLGVVEDMDVDWKGRQMYWVAFDDLGEADSAWFRASEMEVVQ
jgi:hypothetical protein